jgi:hypothetical protein
VELSAAAGRVCICFFLRHPADHSFQRFVHYAATLPAVTENQKRLQPLSQSRKLDGGGTAARKLLPSEWEDCYAHDHHDDCR